MNTNIKLVRVDKRLLHATIALNWNRFINADNVVIADSDYVRDPFIEKVMQLCLPKTMKVRIVSAEHLVDFLAAQSTKKSNTMVLFKELSALMEAVENGFFYNEIQLPYPASRIIMKNLTEFFNTAEINIINDIQKKGMKFYFQSTPLDTKDYSLFKK